MPRSFAAVVNPSGLEIQSVVGVVCGDVDWGPSRCYAVVCRARVDGPRPQAPASEVGSVCGRVCFCPRLVVVSLARRRIPTVARPTPQGSIKFITIIYHKTQSGQTKLNGQLRNAAENFTAATKWQCAN